MKIMNQKINLENKEEIEKIYKSVGNFIKYHYNSHGKRGKNNANY